MEVAASAGGVAGFANRADPLSLPHPLTVPHRRGPRHVRVEVAAALTFAVDQQKVAVENRVIAVPQDPAVAGRDQLGAAAGGDVEPFVGAAAVARDAEFADRAPDPVRPLDREDVAVVSRAARRRDDSGSGRRGREQSEKKGEKD